MKILMQITLLFVDTFYSLSKLRIKLTLYQPEIDENEDDAKLKVDKKFKKIRLINLMFVFMISLIIFLF